MDLEHIHMQEQGKNIRDNGKMIYGMEKELILLVFHLRLLLKVTGKKEFFMEKFKLFIEIRISL
jgi:hypothetical protein